MSDVDTGVFRTSGGWYVEIDVPAEGTQARERHDAQVAREELVRVDPSTVEKVTDHEGATRLVRRVDAVDAIDESDVEDESSDDEEPAAEEPPARSRGGRRPAQPDPED